MPERERGRGGEEGQRKKRNPSVPGAARSLTGGVQEAREEEGAAERAATNE